MELGRTLGLLLLELLAGTGAAAGRSQLCDLVEEGMEEAYGVLEWLVILCVTLGKCCLLSVDRLVVDLLSLRAWCMVVSNADSISYRTVLPLHPTI